MISEISKSYLARFPEYDNHEAVYQCEDELLGLRGFIAIHRTTRGPATGGTRYKAYGSSDEALADALNLSRAMTYKCAVAGVPYGGGKAVLIALPGFGKTEKLMDAYARCLNELRGRFTTGEDVGITEDDVVVMARTSQFVNGLPDGSGDPSPWAARSVFECLKAAFQFYGVESLSGKKIAVKGVGKVGGEFCRIASKDGAKLVVADLDPLACERLAKDVPDIAYGDVSQIAEEVCDAYVPCALGGEFTSETARKVSARIICGAANNQLGTRDAGTVFHERGILYIPDYVANAGGLINVIDARNPGGYNRARVEQKIMELVIFLRGALEKSREENRPVCEIVDELAVELIG